MKTKKEKKTEVARETIPKKYIDAAKAQINKQYPQLGSINEMLAKNDYTGIDPLDAVADGSKVKITFELSFHNPEEALDAAYAYIRLWSSPGEEGLYFWQYRNQALENVRKMYQMLKECKKYFSKDRKKGKYMTEGEKKIFGV